MRVRESQRGRGCSRARELKVGLYGTLCYSLRVMGVGGQLGVVSLSDGLGSKSVFFTWKGFLVLLDNEQKLSRQRKKVNSGAC